MAVRRHNLKYDTRVYPLLAAVLDQVPEKDRLARLLTLASLGALVEAQALNPGGLPVGVAAGTTTFHTPALRTPPPGAPAPAQPNEPAALPPDFVDGVARLAQGLDEF